MEQENKIVVFQEKQIRRVWHQEEWWFSVIDVVETLSSSKRPRKYWSDLKKKLQEEGYNEVSEKIGQLKMEAPDGKMRKTDAANTETMFRIIQSIPSPKAEPFKQWLAKVGYERVQEIENPELAAQRAREYYRALGYKSGKGKREVGFMRGLCKKSNLKKDTEYFLAKTQRRKFLSLS